jgi:predicted deacetylase
MYIRTLRPGSTVSVSMPYIKAMPHADQIRLFREEVYATALERIIIPSNYTASPRRAYAWALRRTITSLTKGWSSRFLIENYCEMRTPDVDYVKVHLANTDKLIPLEVHA